MSDLWRELPRAEQFKVALAVALGRGPGWVRAIDNVTSVGAGFRLRGEREELHDEICLCFFVRRKWASPRARAQSIPSVVASYVVHQGRRRRVLIPTDVSALRRGEPHALNVTDGIVSHRSGNPLELGSACCLVRNAQQPAERYLLSCYHVFSRTLRRPPLGGLHCTTEASAALGPMSDAAEPVGPGALDAALVRVDAPAVTDISVWGLTPAQRATDFDIGEIAGRGQLFVLGRRALRGPNGQPTQVRSQPVPAFFRGYFPGPMAFTYDAAGRAFVFSGTIQYVSAVRRGDSGAALVDTQGMVYGMHFYGMGDSGFALAAPRLFDANVFSVDIVL